MTLMPLTPRNRIVRLFCEYLDFSCGSWDIWVDCRTVGVVAPDSIKLAINAHCTQLTLGTMLPIPTQADCTALGMTVTFSFNRVSSKCYFPWPCFLAAKGQGESFVFRPCQSKETLMSERTNAPSKPRGRPNKKSETKARAKKLGIRRVK